MNLRFYLFVFLLIAGGAPAPAFVWRETVSTALEDALKERKPVLLQFTASWCTYCRLMDVTTFNQKTVEEGLRDYVVVKVDFDRNRELVETYGIRGIPASVILNRYGETVTTQSGYLDAAPFTEWLAQNREKAFSTESKTAHIEQEIARLQSGNPSLAANGFAKLYLESEGKGRTLVEASLKQLADRSPNLVAPLLNHSSLAVRIFVANFFAGKFGSEFVFDPWDEESLRKPVAEAWSKTTILNK